MRLDSAEEDSRGHPRDNYKRNSSFDGAAGAQSMDHLITRPKANNLSDKKSPRNPLDSLFAASDSVVASITADRKTEQYTSYKSSGNR